jgi:hypothetical protein
MKNHLVVTLAGCLMIGNTPTAAEVPRLAEVSPGKCIGIIREDDAVA